MWETVLETVINRVVGAAFTGGGQLYDYVRGRLAERHAGRELATLLTDETAVRAALGDLIDRDPAALGQLARLLHDSGTPRPGAVPVNHGPFVNYERIRHALPDQGVFVLTGPRSVGKTALAWQIAQDRHDRFPDGQVYVDLSDHRTGGSVPRTAVIRDIAAKLGFVLDELDVAGTLDQYRAITAARRFLLVLDGIDSAEDIRTVVPPAPMSLVLLLSREAGAELLVDYPDEVPLTGLDDGAGLELLARLANPQLVHADPVAARELVEVCDHNPGAIRSAGVLVRHTGTVRGVLAQIRGGGHDRITAGFTAALATLSPQARSLLSALASHPGPTVTAQTATVLGASLESIAELRTSNFLAPAGGSRWRLYNSARLVVRPDDSATDALIEFHTRQAVRGDELTSPDRLRRYQAVDGDADFDGRAPLDWLEAELQVYDRLVPLALERGRFADVIRMCGALEVVQLNRGHHWLFARLYGCGVVAGERSGDTASLVRNLAQQGRTYTILHQFAHAWPVLERARELVGGADRELESSVYESLGRFHEESGNLEQAARCFQAAYEIDRELGERGYRACGIHARMAANVLVKLGRTDEALRWVDEALRYTTEPRNLSRLLTVSGKALTRRAPEEAERVLFEAWQLATGAGARQYDLEITEALGDAAAARKDVETARRHWGGVWERLAHDGHPRQADLLAKLRTLPRP